MKGLIVLAVCVGLSYQICVNGICDTDKCSADSDCPPGYSCDTDCGNCEAIPGYCNAHFMCSDYNGLCDVQSDPYTTCNYCDMNSHLCLPGCIDNSNCPTGYDCNGHQCIENQACSDDAYCNQGLADPPLCDVENMPYTTCFYCEGGECLPGCVTNANCPATYTCSNHVCSPTPGSVLINSITVKTKSCTGCDPNNEGVSLNLRGQVAVGALDGIPCTAKNLDHTGVTDYDSGDAKFGGVADKDPLGGCYQAPLNGELLGGTLAWNGAGTWTPEKEVAVCVDWSSDTKFAFSCDATPYADHWNLVNCHHLTPKIKCD